MFIECDEAISILYLRVRHLQPERTKSKQKVKVRLTIDDIEVGEGAGIDSMFDGGVSDWPDYWD